MIKPKSILNLLAVVVMCVLFTTATFARENVGASGNSNKNGNSTPVVAASCNPTTAQAELDINNIRTTVLVGGDMWWNLNDPKYEVPIGSGKHSVFAGSLWIGGIDAGGQVKVAAQTYRQTGIDFWGGPIDTNTVSTTSDRCRTFDRHWKVTKDQVREFIADNSKATNDIKSWPGNGNQATNEGQYLAPFKDVDGDGIYDYRNGDYPYYLLPDVNPNEEYPLIPLTPKVECNDYLFGDETIWWVFNDVGNAHTETGSDPIGLEIRAQAFAFKTNDEINNMTFYKYQIINRSSNTLTETYFGQWVDPDLGYYLDDYVGCDVQRGLGFCYNGDADDETASGYGSNPPALGVDFFQGPIADANDGVDNDRDGCIDCTSLIDSLGNVLEIGDDTLGEQIIMSKFVYYNNDQTPLGNPSGFADFYNYLRGIWRDNQPITYGADGRTPPAPNGPGIPCNFMFPGSTDTTLLASEGPWSELTAGNVPADRRFLQSAGTFTLTPGAVNYVTTGVVWAKAQQGGVEASIALMKAADDKAQALFDNCFKLIDGPNAPNLVIRELDKKFIFSIQDYNTPSVELYSQVDPTIVDSAAVANGLNSFDFQGYQVFQFKDATVTTADIGNPDKVRLLYQCDIKDGVAQLVNFEFDPNLNANVPIEKVNGSDKGIKHTFIVNQDLFATGSTSLVNHKTYYYSVVSYAYNQFKKYDPNDPAALDGQKKPYLAGRNNIKTYSAIPHNQVVENGGQIFGSNYGSGPRITRIEGQGNGGMILDFASDYTNELMSPPFRVRNPTYVGGAGPLDLKVYDPVLVSRGSFTTQFNGAANTSLWQMYDATQDTVAAERPISVSNEQVIPEWGLTATIATVIEAGKIGAVNNGLLTSSLEYANPSIQWLNSIADVDDVDPNPENWILSGTDAGDLSLDPTAVYEGVVQGTWAPYMLTSKTYPGPKSPGITSAFEVLSPSTSPTGPKAAIASVDIVITADKSKWSRVAVVEIGGGTTGVGTEGNAKAFTIRKGASLGKDGLPDGTGTGMSWFPGYAVNVETGERLNMAFGENSLLSAENGRDMKWNPTANKSDPFSGEPLFGGMHYIYVFGHNGDNLTAAIADVPMYDSCAFIASKLTSAGVNDLRSVWKDAMWVSLPMVDADYAALNFPDEIPSDVKVRLRVARTYRTYATGDVLTNNQALTVGSTYYVATAPVTHAGTTYSNVGDSFTASNTTFTGAGTVALSASPNSFGAFAPMYSFITDDLVSTTNDVATATSALDLINVVPNPYYAFSAYEVNQLDNRIKIVNLPAKCTVSIFTVGGTLVRKFNRDVPIDNSDGQVYSTSVPNRETSLDWDLKNFKGIPIASGVYLIHVEAPGLGERTLKWFGMTRPLDLDTF